MTVSTAYEPLTYDGDAATVAFSVTWPFFSGSLKVTLIQESDGSEAVKTISTHYTVAGGTDANGLPATGTVTMLTAPASTEKLRIERVTPRTQPTTYTNGDSFPAKTTEAAFDRLHLLMQEVLYETDRAIKLKIADREAGVDPVLPLVTDNASEAVALNSDEDGVEFVSLSGLDLDVGTVSTLAAGASATASITGTAPDLLLNLGIPRGDTGASGEGSGDLVSTNNLSDLDDAPTALTNLGISSFAQTILDDANAGAVRTTLGLVIGTNVQAYDAELAALAGLTSAADKGIQFTGSGTAAVYDLTTAGKALIDDADAAAQRTTLGLGTAAVLDVGTTASKIVQLDGSAKLPAVDGSQLTNLAGGKLVQRAYTSYATNTDLSTDIPFDDTIPQNTEGTQVLSQAITPTSASNRVRVRVVVCGQATDTGGGCCVPANPMFLIVALFKDSGADALQVAAGATSSSAGMASVTLEFEHAPSTTSAITYKIRVGPPAGGGTSTVRLNGLVSGRKFGGVMASTMIVEEIVA